MNETSPSDTELIQQQDTLQAEARGILDALNLFGVLARIGSPTIVGSLALGLMVWRDIDIEVQCPSLSAGVAFDAGRSLARIPGVYRMVFHDFTGARSIPEVPEGYYWGVRFQPPGSDVWKIDIWLLPEGTTRRTGGPLISTLREGFADEARIAILRLKHIWYREPAYRNTVLSVDIYDAVLHHGVRTPEELDDYLRARGRPARST